LNNICCVLENWPLPAERLRAYRRPSYLPARAQPGRHRCIAAPGFSSAGPALRPIKPRLALPQPLGRTGCSCQHFEQVTLLPLWRTKRESSPLAAWCTAACFIAAGSRVCCGPLPAAQWPQLHGIGWSPRLIPRPISRCPTADLGCFDLITIGVLSVLGMAELYVATAVRDVFFSRRPLRRTVGTRVGALSWPPSKSRARASSHLDRPRDHVLRPEPFATRPAAVAPLDKSRRAMHEIHRALLSGLLRSGLTRTRVRATGTCTCPAGRVGRRALRPTAIPRTFRASLAAVSGIS